MTSWTRLARRLLAKRVLYPAVHATAGAGRRAGPRVAASDVVQQLRRAPGRPKLDTIRKQHTSFRMAEAANLDDPSFADLNGAYGANRSLISNQEPSMDVDGYFSSSIAGTHLRPSRLDFNGPIEVRSAEAQQHRTRKLGDELLTPKIGASLLRVVIGGGTQGATGPGREREASAGHRGRVLPRSRGRVDRRARRAAAPQREGDAQRAVRARQTGPRDARAAGGTGQGSPLALGENCVWR